MENNPCVILFYIVTAIGVFIYLHDEIERHSTSGGEKGIDIFDVIGPIMAGAMWPVLPLVVISVKMWNYVVYESVNEKSNEKKNMERRG